MAVPTVDIWTVMAGAAVLGITGKIVEFIWKTHLENKVRKLDEMLFNRKIKEERKREEQIHQKLVKRIEALEKKNDINN
jgi:hypothetical protein